MIAASAATGLAVPPIAYGAILPELILVLGALGLLMIAATIGKKLPLRFTTGYTCLVSLAALVSSIVVFHRVTGAGHKGYTAIDGAIAVDGFSAVVMMTVSIAIFLVALSSSTFLEREKIDAPEFSVLAMLSASGAMLMASADDLIVVFLGLEILSIALYVLAGSNVRRRESGEAAIKYFVLGAFASALFLYGIALTYGATGSTNLPQIATYLAGTYIVSNGVLLAGMGLLVIGFGFKIAAVPFHTWSPDVYQGSPTPVTSFMAAVAKAGGFAGLIRVVYSTFPTLRLDWQPIIWVLAIATFVVGSVLAVVQRDVKRIMAYSSISHAGFILIGLQAASARGIAASIYYLFTYTILVVGTFSVISVVGGRGDAAHDLDDYRALSRSRPFLAATMTVFLLAQAGVPFTTGFLAKFYVVSAAAEAHSYAIAVAAMVAAVIAAFFYLRVVVYMYSGPAGERWDRAPMPVGVRTADILPTGAEDPDVADAVLEPFHHSGGSVPEPGADSEADSCDPAPAGAALTIALCAAFTVVFGIWAGPIIDMARDAVLLF